MSNNKFATFHLNNQTSIKVVIIVASQDSQEDIYEQFNNEIKGTIAGRTHRIVHQLLRLLKKASMMAIATVSCREFQLRQ